MRFAALFHPKAKKWVQGRANIWQPLQDALHKIDKPVVWFHVASLGEFEQARPVMEGLREKDKDSFFLLLSFFSPSGYEVRHNYAQADFVTYLPLDTKANAERWLTIANPSVAYWVKYEFWWNMLEAMQKQNVPIILFSALFRKKQFFFKPYAKYFLSILQKLNQIFVQNKESLELLESHGFQNAQMAGDTRFDRVLAQVAHFEPVPYIEAWRDGAPILVAGSVWERDLLVILPVLVNNFPDLQIIFAPHEIHEHTLQKIEKAFPSQTIRYSALEKAEKTTSKVLLIDNVGLLARLYHYGTVAYIGGAFKEGLHNILEPASFGIPIVFGRAYQKFPEAYALIESGGAFSIQQEEDFRLLIQLFLTDSPFCTLAGKQARLYIEQNKGGANIILR